MLYSLYFTTCLATNPSHCVTRVHQFDEAVFTPQQCLSVAQPQMAVWQQRHGDRWTISQFRCGKPPRDPGRAI